MAGPVYQYVFEQWQNASTASLPEKTHNNWRTLHCFSARKSQKELGQHYRCKKIGCQRTVSTRMWAAHITRSYLLPSRFISHYPYIYFPQSANWIRSTSLITAPRIQNLRTENIFLPILYYSMLLMRTVENLRGIQGKLFDTTILYSICWSENRNMKKRLICPYPTSTSLSTDLHVGYKDFYSLPKRQF